MNRRIVLKLSGCILQECFAAGDCFSAAFSEVVFSDGGNVEFDRGGRVVVMNRVRNRLPAPEKFSWAEYQLMEALVVMRRFDHSTCDNDLDCELCRSMRGLTGPMMHNRFYEILAETRRMN